MCICRVFFSVYKVKINIISMVNSWRNVWENISKWVVIGFDFGFDWMVKFY